MIGVVSPSIAIRIHHVDSDGDLAGQTAFFARSSGYGVVLLTTAHLLTGSREIPVDPSAWIPTMTVVAEDGASQVELPLRGTRVSCMVFPR